MVLESLINKQSKEVSRWIIQKKQGTSVMLPVNQYLTHNYSIIQICDLQLLVVVY